jgi:hypothetical protein
MKLTIIAVTYGHSLAQLRVFCGSLQTQTDPNWQCYICHDGPPDENFIQAKEDFKNDPRLVFINSEVRNGYWGHPNRKWVVENFPMQEYIHHTNVDNYYCPPFVHMMLDAAKREKSDLVICPIVHSYAGGNSRTEFYRVLDCEPRLNWIDFCGYIIKTDIMKELGFRHVTFTGQDGMIPHEGIAWGVIKKVSKVPHVLSVHN